MLMFPAITLFCVVWSLITMHQLGAWKQYNTWKQYNMGLLNKWPFNFVFLTELYYNNVYNEIFNIRLACDRSMNLGSSSSAVILMATSC